MNQSHKTRIAYNTALILHSTPIPTLSIYDHIRATSQSLLASLSNKNKQIGPFDKDSIKEAILKLERIWDKIKYLKHQC